MSSVPRFVKIIVVIVVLLALLGFIIAFKNSDFISNNNEYELQTEI